MRFPKHIQLFKIAHSRPEKIEFKVGRSKFKMYVLLFVAPNIFLNRLDIKFSIVGPEKGQLFYCHLSVFGWPSLGIQKSRHTPWHWVARIPQDVSPSSQVSPPLEDSEFELLSVCCRRKLGDFPFQDCKQLFNGILIRGLSRPGQDLDVRFLSKPGRIWVGSMARSTILHQDAGASHAEWGPEMLLESLLVDNLS